MKIILLSTLLFALALAIKPKPQHSPLDDIENHDEFNVADVDGLGGFEEVERAYRKRGLKLPESMGGDKVQRREAMIEDLAANDLAARMRLL